MTEETGFSSLEDLKAYGLLIGKSYTRNIFEEGYKFIFNETIADKIKRREKFILQQNKPTLPHTVYQFGFILDIGANMGTPFIVKDFTIPIPNISSINQELKCLLQITAHLNNDNIHDEIFMNIIHFRFEGDLLKISVNTIKSNGTGWGTHLQAHLLVSIFNTNLPIIK
jgi:hypothetical protein